MKQNKVLLHDPVSCEWTASCLLHGPHKGPLSHLVGAALKACIVVKNWQSFWTQAAGRAPWIVLNPHWRHSPVSREHWVPVPLVKREFAAEQAVWRPEAACVLLTPGGRVTVEAGPWLPGTSSEKSALVTILSKQNAARFLFFIKVDGIN